MPDQIDDANAIADAFLTKAKAERQKAEPLPPIGECYFCGDAVRGALRWCSPSCRDECEEATVAERKRSVARGGGE